MKTFLTIIITILVMLAVPKVIEAVKAYIDKPENSVNEFATDEEKIQYTIDCFNDAYENGDFDGIANCMTEKSSNVINAEFGLITKFFGKLLNFFTGGFLSPDDDTISDMWVLGTMTISMKIETQQIDIESEDTAKVYATMIQSDQVNNVSGEISCYLVMKKENNKWLIDNIYEK